MKHAFSGLMSYFLDIRVEHYEREITLSQALYIEKLLGKYNISIRKITKTPWNWGLNYRKMIVHKTKWKEMMNEKCTIYAIDWVVNVL